MLNACRFCTLASNRQILHAGQRAKNASWPARKNCIQARGQILHLGGRTIDINTILERLEAQIS